MKPYQVWCKQSDEWKMLFDSHTPLDCEDYAHDNVHHGNNVQRIEIRDLTGVLRTVYDSSW